MIQDTQHFIPVNVQPGTKSGIWGCVDTITAEGIGGWAIHMSMPRKELALEAFIGGMSVAKGKTGILREDINSLAGVQSQCGFLLPWNKKHIALLAERPPENVPNDLSVQIRGHKGILHCITDFNFDKVSRLLNVEKAVLAQHFLTADNRPMLFFYPDYTSTNPYQRLIAASTAHHFYCSAGTIDQALHAIIQAKGKKKIIFHVHWTTPLLGSASSFHEAELKKNVFLKKVKSFLAQGGIVVWTIHNVVGHENSLFRDTEIALCAELARLATRLHVHSERILPHIEAVYPLDHGKLVIIPHPNYIGVYPNQSDRRLSRQHLGIPEDRVVISFIGQLRPYKGIDDLIAAMAALQQQYPHMHLLVAGRPVSPYRKGTVKTMAFKLTNVTVVEDHVPDNELQWYYNASDITVLPYKNILTSGSILNALSFSVPVIAPDLGAVRDVLQPGKNGLLYNPEEKDGLLKALETVMRLDSEERVRWKRNALESVLPYTWESFGQELFRAVEETPAQGLEQKVLDVFGVQRTITFIKKPKESDTKPRTAVIVLNYIHAEDLQRLAKSVSQSTVADYELIVVDNASPNVTPHQLSELPGDVCIRTEENLGYAGGNNVGVAYALEQGFEFIWILNPDTAVASSALARLLEAAEIYPDVNVFGSLICYGHDRPTIWFAGAEVDFSFGLRTRHLHSGHPAATAPREPFETDYVTGASLFCRASVFKKYGPLPEEYFLYFEETDWCLRLRQHGERLLVVPASRLYHYKRSEENNLPARYYFYYYIRNALIFTQRFAPESLAAAAASIYTTFTGPWLEKITSKNPELAPVYAHIAKTAEHDGREGNTGARDLFAITFPVEHGGGIVHEGPYHLHIDAVTGKEIYGWAVSKNMPASSLRVSLFIDGKHHETVRADKLRPDLASVLPGGGNVAFFFVSPPYLNDGHPHRLQFYVEGTLWEEERLFVTSPEYDYAGRIDGIRKDALVGWALNHCAPNEPLQVAVVVDKEIIALGSCSLFRQDLLDSGIGNGFHGYNITLPKRFLQREEYTFHLQVVGLDTFLYSRSVAASPEYKHSSHDACVPSDLFFLRQTRCPIEEDSSVEAYCAETKHFYKTVYQPRPQEALVSVIMPAFNREATIIQAMESVLGQSYRNLELLVVDDGSVDATKDVVLHCMEQVQDARIVFLEMEDNSGVSCARNMGLRHAQGDVIAYLDSDNIWDEDYLLIMVNALLHAPDAHSAYCGQTIWHCVTQPQGILEEKMEIRTGPFWLSLLDNRNYIDLNCFVHKAALVEALGGFNESMHRLVDWELIHRYAVNSAPLFVPVLLSHYYMGKADNQITAIASYDHNMEKMGQAIEQNYEIALDRAQIQVSLERKALPVFCYPHNGIVHIQAIESIVSDYYAPDRPVVIAAQNNSQSAFFLKKAYGNNNRVIFQFYDKEDTPGMVLSRLANSDHGKNGLVLLGPNAAPYPGALLEMANTLLLSPEAGLVVSTRLIPARRSEIMDVTQYPTSNRLLDSVPFSQPECFVHGYTSHDHITEIEQAEHFCTLVPSQIMQRIDFSDVKEKNVESCIKAIGKIVRMVLGKKIVHAGRARVRDLA